MQQRRERAELIPEAVLNMSSHGFVRVVAVHEWHGSRVYSAIGAACQSVVRRGPIGRCRHCRRRALVFSFARRVAGQVRVFMDAAHETHTKGRELTHRYSQSRCTKSLHKKIDGRSAAVRIRT